jgi:undecaprenyl diphosphate synthase
MSLDDLLKKNKKTTLLGDLPRHVAIIMDGNGRWAKARKCPRIYGHGRGAESVKAVVEAAGELKIEVLTLFAFSEENWSRPKLEVTAIMKLLDRYLVQERENLHANNVQFRTIGSLEKLPESTRKCVLETEKYLKNNSGLKLNVALSYGGRSEIALTCRKIADQVLRGELSLDDISPELISGNLMTAGLPDPDLVIRTSGEYRVSNFLLWQLAYAELYFTKVYWPDFKKADFLEAIQAFQTRTRRYGQVDLEPDSVLPETESLDFRKVLADGVQC